MIQLPSRNIGLELVRVTESTALTAGRWIGSGDHKGTHLAASAAMFAALNEIPMSGTIVVAEEKRLGIESPLARGVIVGTGDGAAVDIVVDPIDGTRLVINGFSGGLSLIGAAPRGTLWSPPSAAVYMNKIVVDRDVAPALVADCMDAPAAWTLALVARIKGKAIRDLAVSVLERPRHKALIAEIRATGARILLRAEGDVKGAVVAAIPNTDIDILMGIGSVSGGVLAACAVKALGGAMLGRLAPQSQEEFDAVQAAGLDVRRILTHDDMVKADNIFFAATGITDSSLLPAVKYLGRMQETHSLLVRSATRTRRFIHAEHFIGDDAVARVGGSAAADAAAGQASG